MARLLVVSVVALPGKLGPEPGRGFILYRPRLTGYKEIHPLGAGRTWSLSNLYMPLAAHEVGPTC